VLSQIQYTTVAKDSGARFGRANRSECSIPITSAVPREITESGVL
jgi:hypothetical protein